MTIPSPNHPRVADTTPPDPAKVGRYRSHRREVEALQWQSTHESFEAIVAFTGGDAVRWSGGPTLLLRGSNGGAATADLGDWIIKNDDGAFEVYPRIDFKVMFSPIPEGEDWRDRVAFTAWNRGSMHSEGPLRVIDRVLRALAAEGKVVVDKADLVAYLNRGSGDLGDEVDALNRLLAAAGLDEDGGR